MTVTVVGFTGSRARGRRRQTSRVRSSHMGNAAIIIRSVGIHQNANAHDAEHIGRRCVDELRSAGHTILSASCETGGSSINIDTASRTGGCPPMGYTSQPDGGMHLVTDDDGSSLAAYKLKNTDAPAKMAYERYCEAAGGVSLVSGATLPQWSELKPEIQAAWMAAVDHTKPRKVW